MSSTAQYQHYSFDLWLTLIKSNPEFKNQRAQHFHQHFNYKNKSLAELISIFRQVDVMCNLINQKTGKNIDADEMYLMVLSMINDAEAPMWDIDIHQLYADMEALFFTYQPVMYNDDTLDVLAHLKQHTQSTIGILSNTGFIKGVTLRKFLNQISVDKYIDFQLYSDEVAMSKPNPEFFKLMLDQLKTHHTQVEPNRVIHIGDNADADIVGANAVGIQSLLVNSNNVYITSLVNNAHHLLVK